MEKCVWYTSYVDYQNDWLRWLQGVVPSKVHK